MSAGWLRRPSGTVLRSFACISGVTSPPRSSESIWVSPATGHTAFTRMRWGASSTAIPWVMVFTAPLEPLYQTSPGRGLIAAVKAVWMMHAPPASRMSGTVCFADQ